MGKYISINNPSIDHLVEDHLYHIVESITSRINPVSIILRGSFGRGEGSVMLKNGSFQFLSDYEIDVLEYSPLHRKFFSDLSQKLSQELGVQVGIRWNRPDMLIRDRIGPFPVRKAKITISLYEFYFGSKTLWGKDIFLNHPPIDPNQIDPKSGLMLLLNRMAESLNYMISAEESFSTFYWINKTILACAESLLLIFNRYHYSYHERGIRFQNLPAQKLTFLQGKQNYLKELVAQATIFKLQPGQNLYKLPVKETWTSILPTCQAVLFYLVEQIMHQQLEDLIDYPEIYLDYAVSYPEYQSWIFSLIAYLREFYKTIQSNQQPRIFSNNKNAYDIVYSSVPLLFLSFGDKKKHDVLKKARMQISKLSQLRPQSSDENQEWLYLCRELGRLWKTYCY